MRARFTVTLALAVLLAGCGDDNGVSTTTTSEASAPTTPPVPDSGLVWARVPDGEAVFGGAGSRRVVSLTTGGPGLVAVGYEESPGEGARPAVWVSVDGYTWTRIDDQAAFGGPGGQWISSVTAGGPGLVAAGYEESPDYLGAAVWVSADGYTWTRIDDDALFGAPGIFVINSVTAGGPGLVAVGHDGAGDAAVWVSVDGYTWTRIDDEAVFGGVGDQRILSVAAGGPGLVAVGHDGAGDAAVWVSVDGYTWTRTPDDEAVFGGPGSQSIVSVAVGGPGLVAAGYDVSGADADAAVWVSADGYTWTRMPDDEAVLGGVGDQQILSVAAGGPGLVAVGSEYLEDSDAAVWVSADGYTWTRIPHDEAVFGGVGDQQILSVAAGGPGLVAAGYDILAGALDAAVWVSPPPG